jgi:hypothetical protein
MTPLYSACLRKAADEAVLIYFSRPHMNSKHGFYVIKRLTAAIYFKSNRSSVNTHIVNRVVARNSNLHNDHEEKKGDVCKYENDYFFIKIIIFFIF